MALPNCSRYVVGIVGVIYIEALRGWVLGAEVADFALAIVRAGFGESALRATGSFSPSTFDLKACGKFPKFRSL